jgi:hypothetical protein
MAAVIVVGFGLLLEPGDAAQRTCYVFGILVSSIVYIADAVLGELTRRGAR